MGPATTATITQTVSDSNVEGVLMGKHVKFAVTTVKFALATVIRWTV